MQRVKATSQIMTNRSSRKGHNKFQIKSQKRSTTYKSKTNKVRPWKLVVPVAVKVQFTHQAKVDTQGTVHPPSKS